MHVLGFGIFTNLLYWAFVERVTRIGAFFVSSACLIIFDALLFANAFLGSKPLYLSAYFWVFLACSLLAIINGSAWIESFVTEQSKKQEKLLRRARKEEDIRRLVDSIAISRNQAKTVVVNWGTPSLLIDKVFREIAEKEIELERELTKNEKFAIRDRILPIYLDNDCVINVSSAR